MQKKNSIGIFFVGIITTTTTKHISINMIYSTQKTSDLAGRALQQTQRQQQKKFFFILYLYFEEINPLNLREHIQAHSYTKAPTKKKTMCVYIHYDLDLN
jgi:hypothetical protein